MLYKIKLFFIVLLSCFLFQSCENDIQEVKAFFIKKNASVEMGKNISLIYSDSGKVILKLYADKMIKHLDENNQRLEFTDGITVDFYDNSGTINSHLVADYAVRIEETGKVIARENVVLNNFEGDTLKTDLLVWDSKKKKIYTDQFVKISTPDEVLYGFGFETDPSFTTYKLNEISGRMQIENLPGE